MPILLIIYFLLFTTLCIRKKEWAIYWTILTLPTYLIRFQIADIPFTLLEGHILILFTVWLFFHAKKSQLSSLLPQKLLPPLTLFLLAATISVFTAPDILAAAGIWKAYFIEPILFLIVFLNVIDSRDKIIRSFWFLGLSIVIPGLFAIYQKFTGVAIPVDLWVAPETRRVTSFYGYPNAIGLYFAPIVAGVTAIVLHKIHQLIKKTLPKKERPTIWYKIIGLGLLADLGFFSIYFASSRGALLGLAATLLFFALFWHGKRLLFAGSILIGLLFISPPLYKGGVTNPTTVSGGSSLETRLALWRESTAMLVDRPITGAGLAGFQHHLAPYHEQSHIEIFLYPHNIILNFWSEIGLLGLLAFLWLVILFFKINNVTMKQCNNWQNHLPYALAGAMVTLLVHGLVDVPYFKNDLAMLFWILFGLTLALHQTTVQKSQNKV